MRPSDSRRAAELLADRAAAVVRVVGRAFGMVILIGLASGLAVLALYLSFDSSFPRAIGILYAVVQGLAVGRLLFHRTTLGRSLGHRSGLADEIQRLVGRTTATSGPPTAGSTSASSHGVGGERVGDQVGQSVVVSVGGSSFDAAGFRRMDDLRQLNSELALAGLVRRTKPLRPRAIALSTLAVVGVVMMTVIAPVLLVVGLLAKVI